MRSRRFLLAALLAVGMNSVAYASENYALYDYSTGTICVDFLHAVKAAHLGGMNKQKLCEERNSPSGVTFAGKKMTNLNWAPYEAADKFLVAKALFENSMPKSALARFHKSEDLYLKMIQVLISKNELRILSAPMEIDGKKVFVIMLQKSRCDGSAEDDWLPIFDFFETPGIDKEFITAPGEQLGGQLVYVEGFPASLDVDPFWGPPGDPHPLLSVTLMSVNYGKNAIFDRNMCQVNITK